MSYATLCDQQMERAAMQNNAQRSPLYRTTHLDERACSVCRKSGPMVNCGTCGAVYCGASCQRAAWSRHRAVCRAAPQSWAKMMADNVHTLTAILGMSVELFTKQKNDDHPAICVDVIRNWSTGRRVTVDQFAEDMKHKLAECPRAATTQLSGCRMVNFAFPLALYLGGQETSVPLLLSHLCITDEVETYLHQKTQLDLMFPPHVHGCIVEPVTAQTARGPDFFYPMAQCQDSSVLGTLDAACSPALYSILLGEREPADAGDWGDYSASSVTELYTKATAIAARTKGSMHHTLLVVCIKRRAFILQSYMLRYTVNEWSDFDVPLRSATSLEVDGGGGVLPAPELRGILDRVDMWRRLSVCLGHMCDRKTAPQLRATAYSALTGIEMAPFDKQLMFIVRRTNLAFV